MEAERTVMTTGDAELDAPWATVGVLVLLWVIFVAQLSGGQIESGHGKDIPVPDLVAFGALNADLVRIGGDWWRLVTAPLLHGGFLHILFNSIALFFAGRFLERHHGGPTMLGLLAVGAVAGAFCSLMFGGDAQVSVGASGGIMALLASSLLLCYTQPEAADTASAKSLFARILIPSLIPASSGVDYAAHFGGAAVGVAVAAALSDYNDFGQHHDKRRILGWIATVAYAAAALYGAERLIATAPAYNGGDILLRGNVAQTMLNDTVDEARARVEKYPGDPQMRLVLAIALQVADKPDESRQEAMRGLRLARTYGRTSYQDVIIPELKTMLALAEASAGHATRAHDLVDPVCEQLPAAFRVRVLNRPETASLCASR